MGSLLCRCGSVFLFSLVAATLAQHACFCACCNLSQISPTNNQAFSWPLVYMQLHATARMADALPKLGLLNQLYVRSLKSLPPNDISGRVNKTRIFIQGTQASMRVHNTSLTDVFIWPCSQIPIFFFCVSSTRNLIAEGGHGFEVKTFIDFI